MSQGNSHDIKVLNGLAGNLSDTAEAYREAVSGVDHAEYRQWFQARAGERDAMAQALHDEIVQRGGTLEEESSILAKAHRAFADIKQALLRNDATVVDSLESSEMGLLGRFNSALDDKSLSATTRETIRRIQGQIEATHEQMSALKHSLDSQRDAHNPLYPS